MPLSDRERRLLAEMEEALATDDPRLQSRLAGATMTKVKPRILLGASLIFAGIAVLFIGLVAQITLVGVAGFLIALTGLLALIRSIGNSSGRAAGSNGPRANAAISHPGYKSVGISGTLSSSFLGLNL